eukprot:TRINITY_DN49467_c0_g1_i1.p1 TRINITY_DN49467_c0_g1~~TRINITY_DN49467_c0_g1_i1.p1  ORF type:complete len:715 (+),score=160.59 TRINITY_DN49467_c0_g1_i1:72-2216(+)
MGQCVAREDQNDLYLDERLLQKNGQHQSGGIWCSVPRKDGTSPFQYKVRFGDGSRVEHEEKVVRCLMELLWVENPRREKASSSLRIPVTASQKTAMDCVNALKALRADKRPGASETVLDLVVPVVNVVLHAPCLDSREVLWERYVMECAETDVALGHLFFWAFRAVETSPQAEAHVKADARRKMHAVQGGICREALLKTTLQQLAEANEAVGRGEAPPKVPKTDPNNVSPLVNVCERLHYIGEQIVMEKDRNLRLQLLQDLVEKEINKQLIDDTPVPAQMLAPHAGPVLPATNATASLLKVTKSEARVLSSKARAPYLVLIEVEKKDDPSAKEKQKRSGLLGCFCPSRKAKSHSAKGLSGPPHHWPPGGSTPSSGRSASSRPKGAFQDETWPEVMARVQKSSQFGKRPNWAMIPLIVKSNADDVRQEELAYRLLKWFQRVFRRHKPQLWLNPFRIIATTHDGGVLEVVSNAISISHSEGYGTHRDLKKSYGENWVSLRRYFEESFTATTSSGGKSGSVSLKVATQNFIWSMAAYSVVCYVLAIRDRHNGNIMLDDEGHVLHVDFGFMLCGAPGGKAMQHMGGFEHSAGFKLTEELVDVLGGVEGPAFEEFRDAIVAGMRAVRQHAEELLSVLQLSMLGSENSGMNCFCHPSGYPEAVLEDVCERLGLPSGKNGLTSKLSDADFKEDVERMIDDSIDHWRSRLYDKFQYHFVGVH